MCQNTKQKMASALFRHCLNRRWGFSGSGAISISKCEDHLNVWPFALAIDKGFPCGFVPCYCSNIKGNISHWKNWLND